MSASSGPYRFGLRDHVCDRAEARDDGESYSCVRPPSLRVWVPASRGWPHLLRVSSSHLPPARSHSSACSFPSSSVGSGVPVSVSTTSRSP